MSKWTSRLSPAIVGADFNGGIDDVAEGALMQHALDTGKTLHVKSFGGYTTKGTLPLRAALQEVTNLTPFYDTASQDLEAPFGDVYYHGDDTAIRLDSRSNGHFIINVYTCTEDLIDKVRTFVRDYGEPSPPAPEPPAGMVHVIMEDRQHNLTLTRLGIGGTELNIDNYMPEVIEGIEYIQKQLNARDPAGRLTILSGPPGTGKTYVVRHLIMAKGIMVILVMSNMIDKLGGPELMPLLLNARNNHKGPIVLVLEDGDHALRKRSSDNMSAVSALLNIGDGIVGALIDARVLVTSNTAITDMDPAVLRDGRLAGEVKIEALSPERATNILRTLMKGKIDSDKVPVFEEPTILAKVYKTARKLGWESPSVSEDLLSVDDDD
jgi:hypothetical protein